MKKLITIILLSIHFFGYSQSMDIRWNSSGIEFSVNTHTGKLNYSVPGGEIRYNSILDPGPDGTIKSIGNVNIRYNGVLDPGPDGTIKSVGNVNIRYNGVLDPGPDGYIKSVGGLSVRYNSVLDPGPNESVKSTSGSVN